MLSPIDHNILKTILLYQSVLEYLKNMDYVNNMTINEKESFKSIILECFKSCMAYNGNITDLKNGCDYIIATKEDIARFYPEIKDLI